MHQPPPTDNLPPSVGQDPHDYVIENSPALGAWRPPSSARGEPPGAGHAGR